MHYSFEAALQNRHIWCVKSSVASHNCRSWSIHSQVKVCFWSTRVIRKASIVSSCTWRATIINVPGGSVHNYSTLWRLSKVSAVYSLKRRHQFLIVDNKTWRVVACRSTFDVDCAIPRSWADIRLITIRARLQSVAFSGEIFRQYWRVFVNVIY